MFDIDTSYMDLQIHLKHLYYLTLLFYFMNSQIIRALDLYRKKTGTDKHFWVCKLYIVLSLKGVKVILFYLVCLLQILSFTLVLVEVQVHLDKKVPTGAGLGGGSSNAATALWAANQFSGGIASEKDLQEWSGEIGSDIPFFFSRGAAYCTGRGEVCEALLPSEQSLLH